MAERMRTASFKLPRKTSDALDELARRKGISRSAVVREAIEVMTHGEKRSVTELAGDLVGRFHGPGDLLTNPKYMDDFGK